MAKFIKVSHPDLTDNPKSYLSADIQSGATVLPLQNTAGFTFGDYVLLGKYGQEQAEIVPVISPVTSYTSLKIGAPRFGHPADSEVTKMDFNQFRIYRSPSGLGGYYTLLATVPIQVENPVESVYEDINSINPYSYRFTYYNDSQLIETDFSDEVPYEGFPFFSLGKLTDRVLDLFNDENEEFIKRNMVADWINECLETMQFEIVGGDSPRFLNSVVIPISAINSVLDISTYGMLEVMLVEFSNNNVSYNQTINPATFQGGAIGNVAGTYVLEGSNFSMRGVPNSGWVRIWYVQYAVQLTRDSDTLPEPFRGYTRIFVDWALMRANEKDRKVLEMGTYYLKQIEASRMDAIRRLKNRIGGPISTPTPWADSFASLY